MTTTEMMSIAIIVVLLLVVAYLAIRLRKSRKLRDQFGPEYSRAVDETGGRGKAETELVARQKRVSQYNVKPLSPIDQQRCLADWRAIQARFVDNPRDAAERADNLLGEVMTLRGYPEGGFDQRLEDLSVDHADAVQNYRDAHSVMQRRARGEASTEDMRQAMLHYRTLFEELVGSGDPSQLRAAS
jgi:hypothetical protein